MRAGAEDALGEAPRFGLAAVAGKAEGDQCVVMRPDRAVMVGDGIEARAILADRADAPAGEEGGRHEARRDLRRALGRRDAGEERVPGAGAGHAARLLGAVEREAVAADLLAPERCLEAAPQRLGAGAILGAVAGADEIGRAS